MSGKRNFLRFKEGGEYTAYRVRDGKNPRTGKLWKLVVIKWGKQELTLILSDPSTQIKEGQKFTVIKQGDYKYGPQQKDGKWYWKSMFEWTVIEPHEMADLSDFGALTDEVDDDELFTIDWEGFGSDTE